MSEEPPFSPAIVLLTLSSVWEAALGDVLKPLGLTPRKYGLLGHIKASPGISFSELARRSRITVQSAHAATAALVSAGWVDDRTAIAGAASSLSVSVDGQAILADAGAAVSGLDEMFTQRHPDLAEALERELVRVRESGSTFR